MRKTSSKSSKRKQKKRSKSTRTKYHRGRNFEYKVKKYLEEKGYYVIRSAGSHGIADLIAIGAGGVYLIQVKNHQLNDGGNKILEEMAVKLITSTSSLRPENIRLAVAYKGENGIKMVSRPLVGWLQR